MLRRTLIALLACALAGLAATPVARADAAEFAWPVDGEVITPYRNGDDRYASGMHRGIDIAAPRGMTVRAATAGTVTFAGRLPDGALDVTIRGADDRYLVSHMHLASVRVRKNARVSLGEPVGTAGSSGSPSSAQPHVHLGMRRAATGEYVDPLALLPPVRHTAPAAPSGLPAAMGTAVGPAAQAPANADRSSRADRGRTGRTHTTQVTLRGNAGEHQRGSQTKGESPATTGVDRAATGRPTSRRAADAPHSRADVGLTAPGLKAARPSNVAVPIRDDLRVRGAETATSRAPRRTDASTRATDSPDHGRSERTLWSLALICVVLAAGIALWRRRAPLPPAPVARVATGRLPSRAARAGAAPSTRRSPV